MSNKTKRRLRAKWFMALVVFTAGFCVGNRSLAVVEECLTAYVILLMPYAYRKTRICPLELMAGVSVWDWPKAFRRMYQEKAVRIMWLYFPCVVIVIGKVVLLLFLTVHWAMNY